MRPLLSHLEGFSWDSEEQKKGYLALVQYLRHHGQARDDRVDATAAFFIQKDHEAAQWFVEVIGRAVDPFTQEIRNLISRVDALERENVALKHRIQRGY